MTLSDDDGWVFLLRNGSITVSRIDAGLKQVAELVRRVRAGIELTTAGLPTFDTRRRADTVPAHPGRLAGSLDGVKTLVVAPAGPLLSLPFEVLLTGPADRPSLADAPWLVRQFTLAHVPAPSNFVSLRKIAAGSPRDAPVVRLRRLPSGDTGAGARGPSPAPAACESARLLAGLPPLPYARKELDAARALLGADASDELLGPAFTADAVLKARLKDYRILQFSTHALLPAELRCQSEPAIITSAPPNAPSATGALLTASAVVGLDLDADLVILSACNSGGPGGTTAGESLSGLARAFFYAGARSLEVTHWSVNDQVAAFLVADTLRRMRENPSLGIAGALRDAQLAMLADAGKGLPAEIAHPFFWAPFAVIGEGGERTVGRVPTAAFRSGASPVYKPTRRRGGRRNGDDRDPRQVRDQAAARPRRHGHRLRGLGPDHRPPRRDQDRQAARQCRSGDRGCAGPLPPRGAGRRAADPSQHRRRCSTTARPTTSPTSSWSSSTARR